jgi:hypothetical protein
MVAQSSLCLGTFGPIAFEIKYGRVYWMELHLTETPKYQVGEKVPPSKEYLEFDIFYREN